LSKSLGTMPVEGPTAGDRFPWLKLRFAASGPVEDSFAKLDDTSFHLLVFGGELPGTDAGAFGELLRIHAIPADPANEAELARARIPRRSFYLIRPDGHVGLCGTHIDAGAIARYATESLGLLPSPGLAKRTAVQ